MDDMNVFYKKNIILAVSIIMIGLLVVGGTYAYLMSVSINVSNGRYNSTLECFNIDYDNGGSIVGTLVPSGTYTGGLSGSLTLGINDSCNVTGIGKLKLLVGNSNSILTSTVSSHCENSMLQTIVDSNGALIDETSCLANSSYTWVTDGTALKYAVVNGSSILSVGYVNVVNGNIVLYDNFSVSNAVDYTIYIWLDGNLSDNTYSNLSFDGEISSTVVQVETASSSSS